jgi:hypothetical protein
VNPHGKPPFPPREIGNVLQLDEIMRASIIESPRRAVKKDTMEECRMAVGKQGTLLAMLAGA